MSEYSMNERKSIAQRLREYSVNPHHVNPTSEAFEELISVASKAICSPAMADHETLTIAYWDFDARRKGYAPYSAPYGQECHAFRSAVLQAIEEKSRVKGGFVVVPNTVEYRTLPKVICANCYLMAGAVIGSLLTLGVLWLR